MFDQLRQVATQSMAGAAAVLAVFIPMTDAAARGPQPPVSLIDRALLDDMRTIADHPIVAITLVDARYSRDSLTQGDIDALDRSWREESNRTNQPVINAYLQVPISNHLAHTMAGTHGLFLEAFIADARGLNVGMSIPTSDFFQADESWFTTALALPVGDHFIDEPEYDEGLGVWRVRVAFPIAGDGPSGRDGVMSIDVNLTELRRRHNLKSAF